MMPPGAIAKAVGADKLVFLTDIEGLYKDINDKSSFISRLTAGTGGGINQRRNHRRRHAAQAEQLYLSHPQWC